MEAVTRYTALGIPEPDVETMCWGQCEGTGFVPVELDWTPEDGDAGLIAEAWRAQHRKLCSLSGRVRSFMKFQREGRYSTWRNVRWAFRRCDGYHMIDCWECGGTGKRAR